jgi:methionine-rich copper-binding protein CopC
MFVRWRLRVVGSMAGVFFSAALVFGHAVVQKASIESAPVEPNVPTSVILRFNSGIEEAFTRVTLVTEGGAQQPLEVAPADGPATVSVRLPALPAGSYALRYRVLAVDGHVTENVLRFSIAPAR